MEEPINNQTNPTINPQETNSEFAKKEPLIYPSTLKKLLMLGGFLIFLTVSAVIGVSIYQNYINRPEAPAPKPTPAEDPVVPIVEKTPLIAYIKNKKAVWITEINGSNKKLAVEVPAISPNTLPDLEWKAVNQLSYVDCASQVCSVETYNTDNKSTITEISKLDKREIYKIGWSQNDSNYLAFIGSTARENLELTFKAGTVTRVLESPRKSEQDFQQDDLRVKFTPDSKYVAFSYVKGKEVVDRRQVTIVPQPVVSIFEVTGVKIDEIVDATDVMIIDNKTIAYKKDNKLIYKVIGDQQETIITNIDGFDPAVSLDREYFAYWEAQGGFANAVLTVYDTNRNIHRNILRGLVAPIWVSPNDIVGVKPENCLSGSCELYQYQTNALSSIEISLGKVTQLDEAREISSVSFNPWYAN